MLPANGFEREYHVRVFGGVERAAIDALQRGIVLDGERFRPIVRSERARARGERGAGSS